MNNKAILEGLLFVVGDEGLTINTIMNILEIDEESAKNLISELKTDYDSETRGIKITFLGDRLKLTTKKEHKDYYKKLIENPESNLLSNAALETLAIIAYNRPITRLEVDKIRGVSSQQMVRKLVAKNLIKESGRSNLPGRPILYDITHEFLDFFGLSSLEDLPPIDYFFKESVDDTEKDLYHSKYNDIEEEEK